MLRINKHITAFSITITILSIILISQASQLFTTSTSAQSFPVGYPLQTVTEVGNPQESQSQYWWLNSGALFTVENNVGKTIQGNLPVNSPWQQIYNKSNPVDTDNGIHPQNIFRLVSRNKGSNISLEGNFQIHANNFSKSSNRNASNGLLFMGRYIDGDNLYYCGLRVDGLGIIKRKYQGEYTTLLQKKVFSGIYNRNNNISLLPQKKPLWIKCTYQTHSSNKIKIALYYKPNPTGKWVQIGSVIDTGSYPMILYRGYYGIRTDFMDVSIANYTAKNI